jgi:alkanesulfonate monooxygenase SsuD/methylene tetrahydromethanopterin reductase-like flavin-dependent oxidoreductase (luciferase family)
MEGSQFRIGVITIQNAPWRRLVERWRFIDKVGFDSLWVADHFAHWKEKSMTFFECWSTLCGMACETSNVRVGTLVTNSLWRHPAWLAKQALTVDHMSNGRLNFGLGAGGSSDIEHSMTGLEKPTGGVRVKRFREYLQIVDQLLRNPVTTFHGEYYDLEETVVEPDTIQKPRPPIYVGAMGPKMLKITAEFADAWNTLADITELDSAVETIRKQNTLLDELCKDVGRDPRTLRRTLGVYESEAMHNIGKMKIYGDLDTIADAVEDIHAIGISEVFVPYPFREEEIPSFERFAHDMVPDLKKKYS